MLFLLTLPLILVLLLGFAAYDLRKVDDISFGLVMAALVVAVLHTGHIVYRVFQYQ